MDFNTTRREVLRLGAVLPAMALASAAPVRAQTIPGGIRTRRNVANLDLDGPELTTYREGVRKMMARPAGDPHNWVRFAQTHRDFCPHGNWYFLPWHRAYLVSLEEAIRQVTGKEEFALPYWNWTDNPQVPAAFWGATFDGQPNSLLDTTRKIDATYTFPPEYVGQNVIDRIMDETDFELFASSRPIGQTDTNDLWLRRRGASGDLEQLPHNSVHRFMRGNMGSFMSPLDPVFWLHHCNCDRIWAEWHAQGRVTTSDSLWRDFIFSGQFVKRDGSDFALRASDTIETTPLGYRYDTVVLPVPPVAGMENLLAPQNVRPVPRPSLIAPSIRTQPLQSPLELFGQSNSQPALLRKETAVPLTFGDAPDGFLAVLKQAREKKGQPVRVIARISDVTPPSNEDVGVRVFLNCDYLSPEVPINDPHYVGSFAFFMTGKEMVEKFGRPSFAFDLTPTLRRLNAAKRTVSDQLVVQFMPLELSKGGDQDLTFTPGKVDILFL